MKSVLKKFANGLKVTLVPLFLVKNKFVTDHSTKETYLILSSENILDLSQ